jgi:hypothetical protein
MGRVFSRGELHADVRQGGAVRGDAGGWVYRQAAPPARQVWLACAAARSDPAWTRDPSGLRRRPAAPAAVAGVGDRTPPVNDVGEPGAGEPHARFDEGALESGHGGLD